MSDMTAALDIRAPRIKKQGTFTVVRRNLVHNKLAMTGLVIFGLLVLMAIFGPLFLKYPADFTDAYHTQQPPTAAHPFGTDELGRDILSRIVVGARWSLSMGLLAVVIGVSVGMLLGALTGYFGGMVDMLLMRFLEIFQSIPGMLMAIAICATLGKGYFRTIFVLSLGEIAMTARLLRGQILSIRSQEYIEAATSINCSKARIIFRHAIPNSMAPVVISSTMCIGNTIMMVAALSFIGLGVKVPTPEWGAMVAGARNYIMPDPTMIIFPGVFIILAVLALNLFGDGLRDAMDPKLKK